MADGVKGWVCVLLFIFKGTLHRPFCRFELRLARAHGVPVVALFEGDHHRDTYVSGPELLDVFNRGELPADLRCIVEKADWNFFYRRQQHENAGMISRLREKLEAATAVGAWPALTPAPDASGEVDGVAVAYRMLDEEMRAGTTRPTAAPSKSLVRLGSVQSEADAVLAELKEIKDMVAGRNGSGWIHPDDDVHVHLGLLGLQKYAQH